MAIVYDILLVRHGESEANRLGRFAYHSWDPHLTEVGRAQARQLVAQLQHAPIKHLATSPLARARETIQPLADCLGLVPTVLADLAEVNLGAWDGARLSDLERSNNGAFHAWRQDPEANPPPGGESILAVGQRVLGALERYTGSVDPGMTVAATHADCIKGAFLVVTQASGPSARSLLVPNLGQLHLRYHANGHRWALVLGPHYFPPRAE
ncbi:MAG: histidine phosphatase family protein [Firmicutes bacterium]|nr:histidine phosphatase family protein [Bacillota bacterium]